MKVAFFIPPAEQRIGGLDAAIDGLRGALEQRGIAVSHTLPSGKGDGIAHFHGLWQPDHACLAKDCRNRGIPYLVSPHGMLEPWAWRHKWWKKWPYFHLVEKRHLSRASAVLATASQEAERLRRFLPRQRIETLPLGLTGSAKPMYHAARTQLGWPIEERVLLFLSRLHPKKGLDLLLKALSTLGTTTLMRLVVVGEGESGYVAGLRRFAEKHAPSLPRIDWVGAAWGEERWKYFQGADLFCLPTHSENFGLAVLEACQVGTPALTTVETPWAKALEGRGFICRPTTASVRSELMRFLAGDRQTDQARSELADWAQRRFHWDELAERYEALYRSVISRTS